jgi:hypothetical protein
MGSADIANGAITNVHTDPSMVHSQTQKATALADADEFLVWDSSVSGLRKVAAPLVRYLPGSVVQTAYAEVKDVGGPYTALIVNGARPTNSTGTQIFSLPFTQLYANSRVTLEFDAEVSTSALVYACACFCVSDNANAIQCQLTRSDVGTAAQLHMYWEYAPGTVAARTYSVRVGPSAAANMYINSISGFGGVFGGWIYSTFSIKEIKQ